MIVANKTCISRAFMTISSIDNNSIMLLVIAC